MFQKFKFKGWRNIKINYMDIRQYQMILALMACVAGWRYYESIAIEKPSPLIPAQSFDRYVKIQQEAKRDI